MVYKQRYDLMAADQIRDNIDSMIATVTTTIFDEYVPDEAQQDAGSWKNLKNVCSRSFI